MPSASKAFWSLILPTIACHTWTPERFLLLKLLCTFGSEAVLNTVCVFLLEWMASCFWIHLLSDPYFGNGGLRRKRLSFTGPMWYDMSAWPLSPKGWKGKTKVNFTKMFFPLWCCGCCFMRFLDMWIPLIFFFEGYNTVSFEGVSFKSRILGDIHLTLTMYSPIEPRYKPPFIRTFCVSKTLRCVCMRMLA